MKEQELMKLRQKEQELMELARESGLECDYLFATTMKRYQRQIRTLESLDDVLEKAEVLVTKEYVKGRENIYVHPAITQFDRTSDSANKSVATLIRIIKSFGVDEAKEESDPLMEMINSGDTE